jgi:hypothetical protein
VQQPGEREATELVGQRADVELLQQQQHRRGARLRGLAEPAHPLVRDAEVDHLGGDGAESGAHGPADQPSDGTAEDQPDETAPHGTRQRGPARLRVDGLAHRRVALLVLDHDDGIAELELALQTETGRRGEELLRAQRIGQ